MHVTFVFFTLIFIPNSIVTLFGLYSSYCKPFWLSTTNAFSAYLMGPSKSSKMSSFDRAHITSYWRSIVNMALSLVVSEIFNSDRYRDLKISRGQPRSLKIVPFDTLHMVSCWCSIVTLSLRRRCEILDFKKFRDLENRVRVSQGHWKCHHSIECTWLLINVP